MYLEELLPEFRKGAKIRCIGWSKGKYIYIPEPEAGEILDETGRTTTIPFRYVMENFWEFYKEPEPDWDYIIKNKCLCWFWDGHDEEMKKAGILAYYDNNHFKRLIVGTCAVHWFEHCRPVRKDEVTFYEDRKDVAED